MDSVVKPIRLTSDFELGSPILSYLLGIEYSTRSWPREGTDGHVLVRLDYVGL